MGLFKLLMNNFSLESRIVLVYKNNNNVLSVLGLHSCTVY